MKHALRIAAVVAFLGGGTAMGATLLSAWVASPITVGDVTFTYVSDTGFDDNNILVDVTQVGANYVLSLGNLAGRITEPNPELKYEAQVTSGANVFRTVGLTVSSVTPGTAVTEYWFSGIWHTDAALPQTISGTDAVSGVVVDGNQTHLYVLLQPTALVSQLNDISSSYQLGVPVPEPETLAVWGGVLAGGVGLFLRRKRAQIIA
jgi:hypothetical protein